MDYAADRKIFATNKLVAMVELLEQDGVSADQALRGVGISPAALQDPQTRMSVRQLLTAYRNAAALARDPDFALKLGNAVRVTSYGIYGFAMLSCATHYDTIDFALRYHGLSCASAHLGFRREETGQGVWTVKPADEALGDARLCRFVVELNAATIIALARDIVAPDYDPLWVRLAFRRPETPMSYEDIFRCEVRFEQGVNEVAVPADWLDRPTQRADRVTFNTVGPLCDQMLSEERSRLGVAGDLRRIFVASTGRFPKIEEAAHRLGMSQRTLRRRLVAEGVSYAGLLNETRAAMAKTYLRDTLLAVEDIADRVGYRDPSNFRQAFLQWTAMTPSQYRRAHRQGQHAFEASDPALDVDAS
ncbi:MAG: AraC family transcriptional regulator [Pseudomonadota bacterium]|jgi:AraC-like DNA-binding protein